MAESTGTRMRKIKQFRLQDVTRIMDVEERERMILASYKRILKADSKLHVFCII